MNIPNNSRSNYSECSVGTAIFLASSCSQDFLLVAQAHSHRLVFSSAILLTNIHKDYRRMSSVCVKEPCLCITTISAASQTRVRVLSGQRPQYHRTPQQTHCRIGRRHLSEVAFSVVEHNLDQHPRLFSTLRVRQ